MKPYRAFVNTTLSKDKSTLMQRIYELIEWYDMNSTRKEDDYTKANLKLVIGLAENIENSEDIMFIEKILDTFCDIIMKQRNVIQELEEAIEYQLISDSNRHNYVSSCVRPGESFTNDNQIKAVFNAFMEKEGKSAFTANDYIFRVQNLWHSFYAEYNEGELPDELSESVIEDEIHPEYPLLNAYNYIEELNCFVSMKIASSVGNRNWLNNRAALNTFGKALYKDEYKKLKPERPQTRSKDFSKYLFKGKIYGKSRLVLAVVKMYMKEHCPGTFTELKEAFPDSLQGSLGVVRRINDVSDKYKGIGGVKRYFVNEDEIINLPSGEQVIVCTQWENQNTEMFVGHAMHVLGYEIEKI